MFQQYISFPVAQNYGFALFLHPCFLISAEFQMCTEFILPGSTIM